MHRYKPCSAGHTKGRGTSGYSLFQIARWGRNSFRVPCKGKSRPVTCKELVPAFEQGFGLEVCVEAVKKFLENIIGKLRALLVKSKKGGCLGIEVKIPEQFMIDGTAFYGNLEMEEGSERDFPVAGKSAASQRRIFFLSFFSTSSFLSLITAPYTNISQNSGCR